MVLPPGSARFALSWSTWIHCRRLPSRTIDAILGYLDPFAGTDFFADRRFDLIESVEYSHLPHHFALR
jgi:hypothetical protein